MILNIIWFSIRTNMQYELYGLPWLVHELSGKIKSFHPIWRLYKAALQHVYTLQCASSPCLTRRPIRKYHSSLPAGRFLSKLLLRKPGQIVSVLKSISFYKSLPYILYLTLTAVLWSPSPTVKGQHADVLLPSLVAVGETHVNKGITSIFKGKSQLMICDKIFHSISLNSAL